MFILLAIIIFLLLISVFSFYLSFDSFEEFLYAMKEFLWIFIVLSLIASIGFAIYIALIIKLL